jgi:hypothetical protein
MDDFEFKRSPSGIDCRDAHDIVASYKTRRALGLGALLERADIKRIGDK